MAWPWGCDVSIEGWRHTTGSMLKPKRLKPTARKQCGQWANKIISEEELKWRMPRMFQNFLMLWIKNHICIMSKAFKTGSVWSDLQISLARNMMCTDLCDTTWNHPATCHRINQMNSVFECSSPFFAVSTWSSKGCEDPLVFPVNFHGFVCFHRLSQHP